MLSGRPQLYDYEVTAARATKFPADMLRYAESWPAYGEDVEKININIANKCWVGLKQSIRLRTIHAPGSAAFQLATERWASFGWTVNSEEKDS